MFQKCPKCDGFGKINPIVSHRPSQLTTDLTTCIVCPTCLGEFVIHEEQGVPPSKVKRILTVHTGPDGQPIEISAKEFGRCGCQFTCIDLSNCDHSKPHAYPTV